MAKTSEYLKLHFIVWIWGFTAILGLLITIPAVEIVFYRTLFAFIALGFVLYIGKKNFLLGQKEVIKILSTGLLISAHWILFFAAARVSTASVCLAGMATCSLWTSFIEPALNKRKINIIEVLLGVVVIVGLYVIFRFEFDHALGLTMAVASAALSALFTVINGKFIKKHNPYMITFYEMLGACIGTALFFPVYTAYFSGGELNLLPLGLDWVYLLILSIVCTVYAYSISVEIMRSLSAFVINLTVNLEPVYGIILAVIIFGEKEKMAPGFYVGTLIILAAVICYPLINRYRRRKAMQVDHLR